MKSIYSTVSKDLPAHTSLNTFIREVANLKGTKAMCLEGGCGACIVAAEINGRLLAVNSCLVSIVLCDGWKVTTVEGLGNKKVGYHTLQAALAEMSGSQCGFCSPGWVMSMYSISHDKQLTMKEIENSFANNLCRCTGYRPILDTFKAFAKDAPHEMEKKIKDIEELYNIKSCSNCTKKMCIGTCNSIEVINESSVPRSLNLKLTDSSQFHKVMKIDEIFAILSNRSGSSYQINGGNTAHGVYRTVLKEIYIDVNAVAELHRIEKTNDFLTFGGNVTLADAMIAFQRYANESGFGYLKHMYDHLDLVATVPVRNIGTIAGNLMLKNQHNEFPSDVFLILETAGAEIHILESPGSKKEMRMMDFLNLDMKEKLIYSVVLPSMSDEHTYRTYKIMPRAQNAHALVNAGFLFKFDEEGKVCGKPNIIIGGIRPNFLHATKTEEYLKDKCIYDIKHVQEALKILKSEINPDHILPDYDPSFRRLLAVCLFYKFILGINYKNVKPQYRSGATLLQRDVSSGKQNFDTDRSLWPTNQPIPKIGSIYQTSGEGEYVNDIVVKGEQVFCALTLADAPGTVAKIEFEEALKIPGVIAFYSAKDIPGKNAFINSDNKYFSLERDEILFADKQVQYAGQPFGIIVAETMDIAQSAASQVKLTYVKDSKSKALINARQVIASKDMSRLIKIIDWPAKKSPGSNTKYRIKGDHECGAQYHFTMETQTCICVPIEDGMDVFSSTQYMDLTQTSIAYLLNVPVNSINVRVRRLGGAYGAKISRATQIACACALVCSKLNRPARLVLTIEDNMRAIGKRTPAYIEYELEVDELGAIQSLDASYYGNVGASFNETHSYGSLIAFRNCYDFSAWNLKGFDCRTDLPANTWCRSPGTMEGMALIEHVMERIARVTGKDPLEVRMINMREDDKKILFPMIDQMKNSSDYAARSNDVAKFNKENRWKKRGISLVPMKYEFETFGQFHSLVSIYARDGTVSVSHAGIEMGQGLHTKVAQVAAYTLGINLDLVSVKPSSCLTSPNSSVTGGSVGSDACGYATQMACKELLKRLEPYKEKLGGNPMWKDLIFEAHKNNVDLCASFMFTTEQDIKPYSIYGVTVSEIELDILTGQHLIRRVDILEDTGISLSPTIDIGQVEGAFIMGIGLWTSEDLIYDPDTGALTNYRTWNYKIPGAKDIPVDFRVSLLRNAPNPLGILRSKATGEPPLCMSCSIPIAIRHALNSARSDAGNTDPWYQLDNALTNEKILLNSLTDVDNMIF
ncbi:hypothetical protein QAD02_000242 [Eretmocerus hayati]|uniref:Uncharacterized protein n=1 Tax=Eretmocerus hayati TaxID=131215 RepID=A0ACC2NDF6_9HYME|nr:hypothetical protein QAD02_000242 [Eretmocerus hayati]